MQEITAFLFGILQVLTTNIDIGEAAMNLMQRIAGDYFNSFHYVFIIIIFKKIFNLYSVHALSLERRVDGHVICQRANYITVNFISELIKGIKLYSK